MPPPKLLPLLGRKIYKTGQTRGADDDQIFQNRVGRHSTCLIPLAIWLAKPHVRTIDYDNGYIILIPPQEYFKPNAAQTLAQEGVVLGKNALVFYELRQDWNANPPDNLGWTEPTSRVDPLGGQYVARIANTTAANDVRINRGYTSTNLKGAGIRQYEFASSVVTGKCRTQLEALFWMSHDAVEQMRLAGLSDDDISERMDFSTTRAVDAGLLDYDRLESVRAINSDRVLSCPLCLEPLSSSGFLNRLSQAEGRQRHDLTVTELNLFHIKELSYDWLGHSPYNLGWGHHHCNVVCKDSGVAATLDWMKGVLDRNSATGGEQG